jgi:hypothetical protein
MARDTLTTLAVVGGAAALGYELLRGRDDRGSVRSGRELEAPSSDATSSASMKLSGGGPGPLVWPTIGTWMVPLPIWQGRHPVISDGWGTPRPGGRVHRGADLMYRRVAGDRFAPGTPNGAAHHVMPDNMVALAASDGAIWSADWMPTGFTIVIDHGEWATYYTHLAALLVRATQRGKSGQRVRVGDPIGIVGASPLDGEHLKHLHFELWRGGPADAVDPAPYVTSWSAVRDPREPPSLVARNLSPYRPVGNAGDPYPDWLRDLDGKSGVASIRSKRTGEVLYVGESASGNLYKNLTRHFQEWRRQKGYPKGNPKEGHDPGVTYDRDTVDVAIEKLPDRQALGRKKKLVAQLQPRDNIHYQPKA